MKRQNARVTSDPLVRTPSASSAFFSRFRPKDWKDTIRRVVRFVAIVALIVSAGSILLKEYRNFTEDKGYQDIRDTIPTIPVKEHFADPTHTVVVTPEVESTYEILRSTDVLLTSDGILPYYVPLYRKNPQLAGWIRFPGWAKKPIDYPVMYSGDNSYYLYRDFYRQTSYSGSMFFDGAVTPKELDRNLVIYGHAMKDRTMFGHLEDYPENTAEHETNRMIYIDLLWTRLEYEVFSTYLIPGTEDYRRVEFRNNDEFETYVEQLAARSVFDFGVEVGPRDRILTLSTCQNDSYNRRIAVHARLVRQIIYDRSDIPSDQVTGAPITGAVIPSYMPVNQPSPTHVPPTSPPTSPPTMSPIPSPSPTLSPDLTVEIDPVVLERMISEGDVVFTNPEVGRTSLTYLIPGVSLKAGADAGRSLSIAWSGFTLTLPMKAIPFEADSTGSGDVIAIRLERGSWAPVAGSWNLHGPAFRVSVERRTGSVLQEITNFSGEGNALTLRIQYDTILEGDSILRFDLPPGEGVVDLGFLPGSTKGSIGASSTNSGYFVAAIPAS